MRSAIDELRLKFVGMDAKGAGLARGYQTSRAPKASEWRCRCEQQFGKVGYPRKPYCLPNDVQWEITKRNMTYRVNPEATTMNLAVRGLCLISNRVELREDNGQAGARQAWMAVLGHNRLDCKNARETVTRAAREYAAS